MIGIYANAQKDSLMARNTIFIEGLGNGLMYSINFDRHIYKRDNFKISIRGGAAYIPLSDLPVWSFPVATNFIFGDKHHLEFGCGLTYVYGLNSTYDSNSKLLISSSIYLAIKLIGYRFQINKGGLFFSIGLIPILKIIELNSAYKNTKHFLKSEFGPTIGLGIGYTIKKK